MKQFTPRPLLKLRKRAHELFDSFWKRGVSSRPEMYRKLAAWMKLPEDRAHFSQFDREQCRTVIEMLGNIDVPTRLDRQRGTRGSTLRGKQYRQNRSELRDHESRAAMEATE